jgi:hypothetical protein
MTLIERLIKYRFSDHSTGLENPDKECVLVLNLKAFKHISNRRWSKTRTDDGKMFHLFAEQKSVFKILLFCPVRSLKRKVVLSPTQ